MYPVVELSGSARGGGGGSGIPVYPKKFAKIPQMLRPILKQNHKILTNQVGDKKKGVFPSYYAMNLRK